MLRGKLFRGSLIGGGATMVISAAVNIYSTFQLIGPTEEQQLGMTRADFILPYSLMALVGTALIAAGIALGRKKKGH